ncbi:MAG TPA: RNA polymerase sigma factor [Balneolales bacterium]|nr:RNA polymerase sigma factor [Balneolales bacterium]
MDIQEFKYHILPMKDKLYRLALAILHNKEEAEDAMQDVMVKLWNQRSRLNNLRNYEAFVMTVTRNLCLDKMRAYGYKNRSDADVHTMSLVSGMPTPSKNIELMDSMQVMKKAIENLPEKQRVVIHLRDVEHYSFEEISDITGIKNTTLRVILSRARKNVREAFIKVQDYENRKN